MNPDNTLHVVAVISNPVGYETRYRLYRNFAKHISQFPNVNLITVEIAFDTRPFMVTERGNPNHIQLRSNHELWHKENMINIGFSRLPMDWKYAAWIDADISFGNPNWVSDTIWALQHHKVVQLFSKCIDLDVKGEPMQTFSGFCSQFVECGRKVPPLNELDPVSRGKDNGGIFRKGHFWHPGFAWAITKDAFDKLGGLMEFPIVGSADHLMSLAFVGESDRINNAALSPGYLRKIKQWEERALRYIDFDLGFVPGTIFHHYHGKKINRGYATRPAILIQSQFDPDTDLIKDSQGVLQLVTETERQRKLKDAIRMYFRQRNEDSTE